MSLVDTDVRVLLIDLPTHIKGYTSAFPDGTYTIYLNSELNYEQNLQTYYHELHHIRCKDFDKNLNVSEIERDAHCEI